MTCFAICTIFCVELLVENKKTILLQVSIGLYMKCASHTGYNTLGMTHYMSWKHSALGHLPARSVAFVALQWLKL